MIFMKKLILTALDNNDEIWYRCFIPFILSLKQTDYQGDIGVIDYQLSEAKKEKLRAQHILIFPAANLFSEILIDRQISAAHIAEKYQYDYLALYDADIWFSSPFLTLFENIKDNEKLYCCYDVIYPLFLSLALPENKKQEYQIMFDNLYQQQGFIWQVGLVVGHSQAWKNYFHYIADELNYLNDFPMIYGVDASVFNLYAVMKNKVAHISEKYNCLPFWGIQVAFQQKNTMYFKLKDEIIEGIHITRYHRESKEYHFIALQKSFYLTQGKAFCVDEINLNYYARCGELFANLPKAENLLTPLEIECSSLKVTSDEQGLFGKGNNLIIDLQHNGKIIFANEQDKEQIITFAYQPLLNCHLPISVIFYHNDQRLELTANKKYAIHLKSLDKFIFDSLDLWQENSGVRYILENTSLF